MLDPLTNRLRVLWLIKGLGPGGAEHLLLAAAKTRNRDDFDYSAAFLLPWKHALVERLEAEGVATACLDVRDERDVRWAGRLRSRLRHDPVDVVHAHSPYVAAIARLVVRSLPSQLRPRIVTTEHNAWSTFRLPTRLLNARTARLDDATIAVSNETRDSMSARARARCEVLVHGIATDEVRELRSEREAVRSEFGLDDETIVIGTVANYHPKKDWPKGLRAMRTLFDDRPDVRAILVGQGPLQSEVEGLHRELGLADNVILPGFRTDAVRLMSACDVFVLGSQWEGLPVAIMEAMALELPIVATAVGGIPATLHHEVDALLVASGDHQALATALRRVVDDPSLRARLAEASAGRAPEFDAARAQARLEAIYREVTQR